MKFMKIHEIEVHISDFRRILKNSGESMDFTDLSPWELESKKYVFMVQVPSVFQGGAPDHKLNSGQNYNFLGESTF